MAEAKFVEWEKKYTWGVGIEVTANKVINLILREENNLIKVNANNEVYTDLQMAANTAFVLNNIEVWATVWRVSTQDGWAYTGTVLAYKTASGSTNMWLYWDNGNLYFFNGSTWFQVYNKPQIDAIVDRIDWDIADLEEELLEEMELLRQELIDMIPTKTSDLQNDSWFITVAVTGLTNYYDKTTIDQFLNLKADKTALTTGLALKVDKADTYEMANLQLNEQWHISETFTTQQLGQTMAIIKHALSTLYDGKANAADTTAALNLKADITYVDELVGSTLWVSTIVVDTLPVVWQGNYIYLVPVAWQPNNYTKYVWNATAHDYINLGTTDIDLSNMVTLNWTQTITWVKTFAVEPILPANTQSAGNVNTKAARESQVYQVSQSLSSFQNTVTNDYATKQELDNAIDAVEGWVWAWNITVQLNGSTTWVTNSTFWVNQASDQTVNITVSKSTVWLSNVDNTSDVNKPVSTAQATAIAWAVSALADEIDLELADKQDKLVSWTNIKTINSVSVLWSWDITLQVPLVNQQNIKSINWNSLLGSWNLTLFSSISVTLTVAWWNNDNEQSVSATWVTASNNVIISPNPSNIEEYWNSKIYCSAQTSWSLTFTCTDVPENDITVNVLILN